MTTLTKTNILIVEDDGTIAVRLQRLLEKWNYEPLLADSSNAALRRAADESPALALMDIRLDDDDMDGIATAGELRARFGIPSIYVTAYIDEELLERAKTTEPYGYLVKPLQELSLRTTIEMALAKLDLDRQLHTALQEKEILMREILHRTKNNMYAITGLLSLQAAHIQNKEILETFREIENRIQAMALVQEKLYQSKELTHISLNEYLMDLAYTIFRNLQVSSGKLALTFDLDSPITVSIDTAIPCGLALNELLTNALKYAFPGDRTGTLCVALHPLSSEEFELRVTDDGVGLPEGFEITKVTSLGGQLIRSFVSQLKGTLNIVRHDPGTEFVIRFRDRKSMGLK